MKPHRFVILVLDGLRPDLITSARMPRLYAFAEAGAVLESARAQFPSQTRVNKTTFATGALPREHGALHNVIYAPELRADALADLGDASLHMSQSAEAPVVTAPTLSSVLGQAGKRYAAVHCAMPGAPWLLNAGGPELGQEHLSMAGFEVSTAKLAQMVRERLGQLPEAAGVDHHRSAFALRALTEVVWPELQPDVAVMWCDEPDKSLHVDGLGGPVSEAALAHVDELAGRLIDWWQDLPDREAVNLMILSDHGHSEITHALPLRQVLADLGLPCSSDPAQPGPVMTAMASGGIWMRGNPGLEGLVETLQAQDWCGHLFTAGAPGADEGHVPGTFSTALLGIDHPRAPDLYYTLRQSETPEVLMSLNLQGSMHGGTHRDQLRNTFLAAGPAFRPAHRSSAPGGMIDVAPTILHLLGIEAPQSMSGTPLTMLLEGGDEGLCPPKEVLTTSAGSYRQNLVVRRLPGRTVLEHGWTGA